MIQTDSKREEVEGVREGWGGEFGKGRKGGFYPLTVIRGMDWTLSTYLT